MTRLTTANFILSIFLLVAATVLPMTTQAAVFEGISALELQQLKKRLPDLAGTIASSESFLRGSLNTIANLDFGNDKLAKEFAHKIFFPEVKE